jgi:acyl carrier protein
VTALAPDPPSPDPIAGQVEALLDRIRRAGVAPVGVTDYGGIRELLTRALPGLADPAAREALRGAVASMVATTRDEWTRVWQLSEFLETPSPAETATADDALAAPPTAEPTRRRRLWERLVDGPRWLLAVPVVLLAALVLGVAAFIVFPRDRDLPPATTTRPSLDPPVAAAKQWTRVPLNKRVSDMLETPREQRTLDERDLGALTLGGLLTTLGVAWALLARGLRRSRKREADRQRIQGEARRRELSRTAEANDVSRRLTYFVPPTPALSHEALADSATVLARIFGHVTVNGLDIDGTITATIADGGRFSPIQARRVFSRHLTVLVDMEKGDHPWAGDIQWLLDGWSRLGVEIQRYVFHFDPSFLCSAEGFETTLEALARRSEGESLLIISRRLSTRDFRGQTSAWLNAVDAWPLRAWLDPAPIPFARLPRDYRLEVRRLSRQGFARFPFSDSGVRALATHLAGGATRPPEPEPLPSLADRHISEAVQKWALFASLVPDPTWAQLQHVRATLPELRTLLPTNSHLQRLLDWAERANGERDAESGDGRTLSLDPRRVEQLIQRARLDDAGRPEPERLEARCRQMLLDQLGVERPQDALMHEFWQLKRAEHSLALGSEAALPAFDALVGGAWHEETLLAMETALARDEATRTLGRAVRDGLRFAVDQTGDLVRWSDLLRPRPLHLAVTGGLVALAVIALARPEASWMQRPAQRYKGELPADAALVRERKPPRAPGPGPNRAPGPAPGPGPVAPIVQPPPSDDPIFDRVARIVTEDLNVPMARVTPNARLVEDLGADKLDLVKMDMDIDASFGVNVELFSDQGLGTIQGIVDFIKSSIATTDDQSISKYDNTEAQLKIRSIATRLGKRSYSSEIDPLIKNVIVDTFDVNASRSVDTEEEISHINCGTLNTIDDAVSSQGWFGLYTTYGLPPDYSYVADTLGFDQVVRALLESKAVACALRDTPNREPTPRQ